MAKPTDIAAYYFPNYHQDPRSDAAHGRGWTEQELLRHAIPRFPGHSQPKTSPWGIPILPSEAAVFDPNTLLDTPGFASIGSYIWICRVPVNTSPANTSPETPCAEVLAATEAH